MLLEFEKHSFKVFSKKTAKKRGSGAVGAGVAIGRLSLSPLGPSWFPPRCLYAEVIVRGV